VESLQLFRWMSWAKPEASLTCDTPRRASKSSRPALSRSLYSWAAKSPYDRQQSRRTGCATLYSPEQRQRRDTSRWTLVQAILAPVQFGIFLISVALVARYLMTGEGFALATVSVVVKTVALYAIMMTGSLWEKAVFGQYLFAKAFFWEDVFSMLVLALHTAYLATLASGALDARGQMYLALAAYVAYAVNATQFLLKLRAARLERRVFDDETSELVGFVQ
jgi:3-vinyl bacteriochlorophyllide hydratase